MPRCYPIRRSGSPRFRDNAERCNGNNADDQGPQTRKRGAGGMDLHRKSVGGWGAVSGMAEVSAS